MRVSQKLIEQQAAWAFISRNANYHFLMEISHHPKQKKLVDFEKLKKMIKLLQEKFSDLDLNQQQEWQSNILNKVSSLLRRYINTSDQLLVTDKFSGALLKQICAIRQSLYTVVYICVIYQIQYDSLRAEEMIKQFYYREYGDEIIVYFQSANFDIKKYTHLYSKKYKAPYLCCKERIEEDYQRLD